MMLGKGAEFTRVNVPFGGLPDLLERVALRMASISGMPATRFLGRAPQGMNATGEGDERNYAIRVAAIQRRYGAHAVAHVSTA